MQLFTQRAVLRTLRTDLSAPINRQFFCSGSTQGIGYGMLRALAGAGADVVMHGLASQDELKQKTQALQDEFGVKVGFSSANVRKPQEIRCAQHCSRDWAWLNDCKQLACC